MARSDARLIFGSRNSNPLTSFLQGRELKRQREREDELFEMAKEDRQREQTIQDEDREAARAANEAAAQRQRDLENLQSITAGAVAAKPLLDDVETLPQAIRMLEQRAATIEAQQGDASDTREVLDMIRAGRIDQARAAIDSAIQVGERLGVIEMQRGQTSQARPSVLAPGSRLVSPTGEILAEGREPTQQSRLPIRVKAGDSTVLLDADTLEQVGEVTDPEAERKDERRQEDRQAVADVASSLLDNFDKTKRVFGVIQGRSPTVRSETADAEAEVERLDGS